MNLEKPFRILAFFFVLFFYSLLSGQGILSPEQYDNVRCDLKGRQGFEYPRIKGHPDKAIEKAFNKFLKSFFAVSKSESSVSWVEINLCKRGILTITFFSNYDYLQDGGEFEGSFSFITSFDLSSGSPLEFNDIFKPGSEEKLRSLAIKKLIDSKIMCHNANDLELDSYFGFPCISGAGVHFKTNCITGSEFNAGTGIYATIALSNCKEFFWDEELLKFSPEE